MGTKKREDDRKNASKSKQQTKKAKVEDPALDSKSPAARAKQRAAGNTPTAAGAAAAAKTIAQPPPPPYQPETSELEKKRMGVADELRHVERQIFDLETKYLEQSSAFGNAVRGYEGFLGGVGTANRKVVIKPDERLFSSSSLTGHAAHE